MDNWLLGIGIVALAVWLVARKVKARAAWQARWRKYESQPYD